MRFKAQLCIPQSACREISLYFGALIFKHSHMSVAETSSLTQHFNPLRECAQTIMKGFKQEIISRKDTYVWLLGNTLGQSELKSV